MNTVEACIQFTPGLINDDGEVTSDCAAEFLRDCIGRIPRFHRVS